MNTALKERGIQFGASSCAGLAEICALYPLDVIKTRLQLQGTEQYCKLGPSYYSGIFDCCRRMYFNEGATSLWKGMLPPLVAEVPRRVLKFFAFDEYRRLFQSQNEIPVALKYALAGFAAGATEAIVLNPFEVVKVTLQTDRSHRTEMPGTWVTAKQIVHEDGVGFRGLNKGMMATIYRHGIFNMAYFGFYYFCKDMSPHYEDPKEEFFRNVCIGFASGSLAAIVTMPFDVAKSRIQGPQPVPWKVKYRGPLRTMVIVYKEEGFRALYRGLLPKVIRLAPGTAILIAVYDYMHDYMTNNLK